MTGTSKVLEIERKGATFVKGSTMVNLSVEDIKKIVLAHFPDAKNIEVDNSQGATKWSIRGGLQIGDYHNSHNRV